MAEDHFLNLNREQLEHIFRIHAAPLASRISDLLIEQLRFGLVTDVIHSEKVLDEIFRLENGQKSRTEPERQFKCDELKGFWYKHFFQTNFLGKNLMNHWKLDDKKSGKMNQLVRDSEKKTQEAYELSVLLAKSFVEGFHEKSAKGKLTGEWIIFSKFQGERYYLTLGSHAEGDSVIRDRILLNCTGQFPFLFQ